MLLLLLLFRLRLLRFLRLLLLLCLILLSSNEHVTKQNKTKMNMISIDRNAVVTRFFLSLYLSLIILSTLKSAHIFVCYFKMVRIASWGHRSPLNSHMSIGFYNVYSVLSENKTTKCIQFISVWCICMCMFLFLLL